MNIHIALLLPLWKLHLSQCVCHYLTACNIPDQQICTAVGTKLVPVSDSVVDCLHLAASSLLVQHAELTCLWPLTWISPGAGFKIRVLRGPIGLGLQGCLPFPGGLHIALVSAARVGQQSHGGGAGGLHLAHLLLAQTLSPGVHSLSGVPSRQVEGPIGAVG